jgi:tetrapyrrole methylase family protein / MazG family protein
MNFNECSKVMDELGFDKEKDIVLINGTQLSFKYSLLHSPDEFALYWFPKKSLPKNKLYALIGAIFDEQYQLTQIIPIDHQIQPFDIKTELVKNINLDNLEEKGGYLFFKPAEEKTSLNRFIELIAHLRAPDGCPWDRKQTLQTLRTNLLEESYEVLETIDRDDMKGLKEELGDLLLQIVLEAQIASENCDFNIYDVINGIFRKIVFRHPHVFEDIKVDGINGVLLNWEKWKAEERAGKKKSENFSILATVPKSLPALSLAQKYQERAARVGFDWPDISPVIEKIEEEIEEVKRAEDNKSKERELGDLLFALVNLIRWYGFDAESLLRQMNQRFLDRFNFIENEVAKQDRQMTDLSLVELDAIWDQAKKAEAIKAQNAQ